MKVKYIKHGLACRIKDRIYLNKALKQSKNLHAAILTHEREHSDGFTWKDVKMDLTGSYLGKVKKEYYKFILTHPSTWTMYLPLTIYEKKLVFDPMMTGIWLIGIALGGVISLFI